MNISTFIQYTNDAVKHVQQVCALRRLYADKFEAFQNLDSKPRQIPIVPVGRGGAGAAIALLDAQGTAISKDADSQELQLFSELEGIDNQRRTRWNEAKVAIARLNSEIRAGVLAGHVANPLTFIPEFRAAILAMEQSIDDPQNPFENVADVLELMNQIVEVPSAAPAAESPQATPAAVSIPDEHRTAPCSMKHAAGQLGWTPQKLQNAIEAGAIRAIRIDARNLIFDKRQITGSKNDGAIAEKKTSAKPRQKK